MSVANVYAKALYESATAQKDSFTQDLTQIDHQLEEFAKTLASSKELNMALCGPIATPKEKVAIAEAIAKKAGATELVTKFLVLLASKGRLNALSDVQRAFGEVRMQHEGGVIGTLLVADAVDSLSQSDLDSLTKAFTKKLGKKVHFRVSSDPSLLAGMKVTVGGTTYDGSLRAQLQRLRDQLTLNHPS